MSDLQAARSILETLSAHGYAAFFVGGYVRDTLLQKNTNDIDIATSARPEEVISLFAHTVATGLQHGTVSVIINRIPYEVTTFRTEGAYVDARRPEQVTYIREVREDLRRRDFTINAMALDAEGTLLDPFDGRADLEHAIVRAVGDANLRFTEDALRMLRCVRFAVNLSFSIEEETWQALVNWRVNLQHISIERVRVELDKMFEGPHPSRALELLAASGLHRYFKGDVGFGAALQAVVERETTPAFFFDSQLLTTPVSRWAAILLRMGLRSLEAAAILRQLTHANQKIGDIVRLMQACEYLLEERSELSERWRRAALLFGVESTMLVLEISANGQAATDARWSQLQLLLTEGPTWLAQMPVRTLKDLAVDGTHLMEHLQRKNGPWLRSLLQHLLEEVAFARLANERHALLTAATRWSEVDGHG